MIITIIFNFVFAVFLALANGWIAKNNDIRNIKGIN